LEEVGTQNHQYQLPEFCERFRQEFGDWEELELLAASV
jgi:hypothetical protein